MSMGGACGCRPKIEDFGFPDQAQINWGRPNQRCFTENNSTWQKFQTKNAAVIRDASGNGHVFRITSDDPGGNDINENAFWPSRNGVVIVPGAGEWFINIPLAGSSPATVCFVVTEIDPASAWALMALTGMTQPVDVVRWGGVVVTSASNFDSTAVSEQASVPQVRGSVTARDSSQTAGSQNVPIEARALTAGGLGGIEGLLTISAIRVNDPIQGSFLSVGGLEEIINGGVDALNVQEIRKSGYQSSRRGRRFSVTGASFATIAGTTALTVTIPQFLMTLGATNEVILRRAIFTISTPGTATSSCVLIKTDTTNRFSSGGTARTAQTLNGGNVIATTVSCVDGAAAITATAEGGGTRQIWQEFGGILAGSRIAFEPEDGLVIPSSGSLLAYFLNATAGANWTYYFEFEDVNVQ